MTEDTGTINIEEDPLRWRLDYKLALLQDEPSPALLLEMSRESIRTMRAQLPLLAKIQRLAPGQYHVATEELDDLERRRVQLKGAAPGQFDLEEYVDHVVDTAALMARMSAAMERFSADHKDQVAAIEAGRMGRGCVVPLVTVTSIGTAIAFILTRA